MTKEIVLNKIYSIRDEARRILDDSRDLAVLNEESINSVLAGRVLRLRNVGMGNIAKAGKLPMENELGLSLFFNVVNFCFKDPYSGLEYSYKNREGLEIKRSTGLLTALRQSGIDWNDLGMASSITEKDWKQIIQLDENKGFYLGEERRLRIVGLADCFMDMGNIKAVDFLEPSGFDAFTIIGRLERSGFFKDRFLKRAQLAVRSIDNNLREGGLSGVANIEKLTCMADYRLPQVFYNLGSIRLSNELEGKLINGVILQTEGREEEALRSSVIVIGKMLSDILEINETEVDSLLWNLSQIMERNGEMKIPHMLVATDKY